ncbi:MAG: AAA family ATPase [Akkermansia sp.]|nr:AAA family ATPase [Akkermansia sp.]
MITYNLPDYIQTPPDKYVETINIKQGLSIPRITIKKGSHQNIGQVTIIEKYGEPLRKQLIEMGIPKECLFYAKLHNQSNEDPILNIFLHNGSPCSLTNSIEIVCKGNGEFTPRLKWWNTKDTYDTLKNYQFTLNALKEVLLPDDSAWILKDNAYHTEEYTRFRHINREITLRYTNRPAEDIFRFYQAICYSNAYPSGKEDNEKKYAVYSPQKDVFDIWYAKTQNNLNEAYKFLTELTSIGDKQNELSLPPASYEGKDACYKNLLTRYNEIYKVCEKADTQNGNASYRELLFARLLSDGIFYRGNEAIVFDIIRALFPGNNFIPDSASQGHTFLQTLLTKSSYGSCSILSTEPIPIPGKSGFRTYATPYKIVGNEYYISSQWGWDTQALKASKVIRNLWEHSYVTEEVKQRLIQLYEEWAQKDKKKAKSDMDTENNTETEQDSSNNFSNTRNLIYFGAPGTGKSYLLNEKAKGFESSQSGTTVTECGLTEYVERVTFHTEYTYFDFVGSYKPMMEGQNIKYAFEPGPFARVLKKALSNPGKDYLLIIEEINRARVAAVFGDMFQLLDRNKNGQSEYFITPAKDLLAYLTTEEKDEASNIIQQRAELEGGKLRLPANMYIWATMNSADQGVFPMDTAFKRRWSFKYVGIDESEKNIRGNCAEEWKTLRKRINQLLQEAGINEDKQLGPFFLKETELEDTATFKEAFSEKVIMYLFEDAARHHRSHIFKSANLRYSALTDEFNGTPDSIFNTPKQQDSNTQKSGGGNT